MAGAGMSGRLLGSSNAYPLSNPTARQSVTSRYALPLSIMKYPSPIQTTNLAKIRVTRSNNVQAGAALHRHAAWHLLDTGKSRLRGHSANRFEQLQFVLELQEPRRLKKRNCQLFGRSVRLQLYELQCARY